MLILRYYHSGFSSLIQSSQQWGVVDNDATQCIYYNYLCLESSALLIQVHYVC